MRHGEGDNGLDEVLEGEGSIWWRGWIGRCDVCLKSFIRTDSLEITEENIKEQQPPTYNRMKTVAHLPSLFCFLYFVFPFLHKQRAELPFTIISQQVLCTTSATEEHDFLKQASVVFFCNSNLMHNMLNTSVIQNRLLNRSVLISLFVCFQGPTSVCFDTQERRSHPSPHINNRLMISAQGSSDMWGSSTQDSRRWDVSHQHKSSF